MKKHVGLVEGAINLSFHAFQSMIKYNKVSTAFYILLLALETYQLLYYPYFLLFKSNFDQPVFQQMYNILKAPNIESYAITFDFNTILIINCAIIIIFALVFIIHFILVIKETHHSSHIPVWFAKTLGILSVVYLQFMLKPIVAYHLAIFRCTSEGNYAANEDIKCWVDNHIIAVIGVCISLIIQIFYICIITTLYLDLCPLTSIPWSGTQDTFSRYLKYLYKIAMAGFEILDWDGTYSSISLLIICALCGLGTYLRFVNAPPFNTYANRALLCSDTIVLVWSLLAYGLSMIETPEMYSFLTILFEFLSLFVICIIEVIVKDYLDRGKLLQYIKETEEDDEVEYLYALLFKKLHLAIKGTREDINDLYGIIRQHQLECYEKEEEECFCKEFSLEKEASNDQNDLEESKVYHSINTKKNSTIFRIYNISINSQEDEIPPVELSSNLIRIIDFFKCSINKGITQNQNSLTYRLLNAYMHRCFTGNYIKSIYELMYVLRVIKPGLKMRFQLHLLNRFLEDDISNSLRYQQVVSNIVPEDFIEFDKNFILLQEEADTFSNGVYRFWQQACLSSADANEMAMLSSIISQSLIKIEKYNRKCLRLKPNDTSLLIFMVDIHNLLLNNDKESSYLLAQIDKIKREVSILSPIMNIIVNKDSESLMLVVSGNPGSIGKIMACNGKIDMLNYKALDLLNENISMIIPSYVACKHVEMIEHFIEGNAAYMIGKFRIVHALSAQKFLIPIRVVITCLKSLENGNLFFALIRPLESTAMYFSGKEHLFKEENYGVMVTSMEGILLGISEICITMGFPFELFNEKSSREEVIFISSFIQDLKEEGTELEAESEGKIVTLDTRLFLRVNLKENKAGEQSIRKEGVYKILLRLSKESYGDSMIKVKIWRFIMLEQVEQSSEKYNDEKSEKSQKAEKGAIKSDDKFKRMLTKKYSFMTNTPSKPELIPQPTIPDVVASPKPPSIESSKEDYKDDDLQLNDARSAKKELINDLNSKVCKRLNIIYSLLICLAAVFAFSIFGILWQYMLNMSKEFSLHQSMIEREASILSIISEAHMLVSLSLDSLPSIISNSSLHYQIMKTFLSYHTDKLRQVQDVISKASFLNSTTNYYESGSVIDVISWDNVGNEQHDVHSINTAITQLVAKIVNLNSFNLSATLKNNASMRDSLKYIIKNGLGNLTQTLYTSRNINEATYIIQQASINYTMLSINIIWLCMCFVIGVVIVDRIIKIKRNKIVVLAMFFKIPPKEINLYIDQCTMFIRKYKYCKDKIENEDDILMDSENTYPEDSISIARKLRSERSAEYTIRELMSQTQLSKMLSVKEDAKKNDTTEIPTIVDLNINQINNKSPHIESPNENKAVIEECKLEKIEEKEEEYEFYSESEESKEEAAKIGNKENSDIAIQNIKKEEEEEEKLRNQAILQNFTVKKVERNEYEERISINILKDQLTVKKRSLFIGFALCYIILCTYYVVSFVESIYLQQDCVLLFEMQEPLSFYYIYPYSGVEYLHEYLSGLNYIYLPLQNSMLQLLLDDMIKIENQIDLLEITGDSSPISIIKNTNTNNSCGYYQQQLLIFLKKMNDSSTADQLPANACEDAANGIAGKGSHNLHFALMQEILSLYQKLSQQSYSADVITKVSSAGQIYDSIMIYFIGSSFIEHSSSIMHSFSLLMIWALSVYLILLIILRAVGWRMYMKTIKNEVHMSTGMLSILANKYIGSLNNNAISG